MGVYRCTMYFSAPEDRGWSETYITQQTSDITASTLFQNLMDLRLALLTPSYYLVHNKLHLTFAKYSAKVDKDRIDVPGNYSLPSSEQELPTDDCLLVELQGASYIKGKKYLHGQTTEKIDGDVIKANTAWDALFNTFQLELTTNWYIGHNFIKGEPSTVEKILFVNVIRSTSHKVGRPFGAPRGRRSRISSPLTRAARSSTVSALATAP